MITGQNNISHPAVPVAAPPGIPTPASSTPIPLSTTSTPPPEQTQPNGPSATTDRHIFTPPPAPASPTTYLRTETEHADTIEDANPPGSLPSLRKPALTFSKAHAESDALPARIQRLWYINPYGDEIRLPANPRVLDALATAHSIVYSIGSLFTSIIPSLILRGVGDAIATNPSCKAKVLILNGCLDRETGPPSCPFAATDFVAAIADAARSSRLATATASAAPGRATRTEWRDYVTHVLYVEGPGTPRVDREALMEVGIECIRVIGRRVDVNAGADEGAGEEVGCRYDGKALGQALEMVVGGVAGKVKGERSRRNTLER